MQPDSDKLAGLDPDMKRVLIGLYDLPGRQVSDSDGHALQVLVGSIAPDSDAAERSRLTAAVVRLATPARGRAALLSFIGDNNPIRTVTARTRADLIAPIESLATPIYQALISGREEGGADAHAALSQAASASTTGKRTWVATPLPPIRTLVKMLEVALHEMMRTRQEILGGTSPTSADSPVKMNVKRELGKVTFEDAPVDAAVVFYYLKALGLVVPGDDRGEWVIRTGAIAEEDVSALIAAGKVPKTLQAVSTYLSPADNGEDTGSSAELRADLASVRQDLSRALDGERMAKEELASLRDRLLAARTRAEQLQELLSV